MDTEIFIMGVTIIIISYNFSAYECDAMNQKKGIRDSNVELEPVY